jgi:hypothetical protein
MNKFPLLEQMRAERLRREAEITASFRAELTACSDAVRRLRSTIRELERIVGSEIAQHVVREVAHSLSGELRRLVYEAVARTRGPTDPVAFTLPGDVLRFMDPKSLERSILDQYANEALPALSLGAEPSLEDAATILDIRIPAVGYRRSISR